MVTTNRQQSPIDAYKANRTPQQMGGLKRQKLLTEGQQAITKSRPLVAIPASTDDKKRGKPTPRNKRVQSGESGSPWVCNLLGAKQVNSGPASDKGITADRCAKCANQLVGSQLPTHCLRCNTVKYCNDTCKRLHWKQGHGKTCTSSNTGCPACGEDVNIEAETSTPRARCERVVYCSHRCLNSDFDSHLHQCPVLLPAVVNDNCQQMAA